MCVTGSCFVSIFLFRAVPGVHISDRTASSILNVSLTGVCLDEDIHLYLSSSTWRLILCNWNINSAASSLTKTNYRAFQVLKVLVTRSCLTLCNPMDCSPPYSPVHGILRARILEWVAIPFSRVSPWPKPGSPALQADYLLSEPPGSPRYQETSKRASPARVLSRVISLGLFLTIRMIVSLLSHWIKRLSVFCESPSIFQTIICYSIIFLLKS